jgi:acetyltransferase-like isoleucine patch superfamily enzyme/dTDP-4-dehydrorhamnose 3,5-epimerase-like enzyme
VSDSFRHPQALVESQHIGRGTRIWAFAHVLPGAVIGEDCNICDHTFIENDVVIGNRVTIKCGVQVWDGLRIEDDVLVGPNATFTNDPMPRSQQHLRERPVTYIRRGASIGANATILPGITIGQNAMVGAGAVVTRSVPPHAVVVGNPARIVRYSGSHSGELAERGSAQPRTGTGLPSVESLGVRGVVIHRTPVIKDMRGNLLAREIDRGLPFVPKRCFTVFAVPSKEVRGAHAHRALEQLLICLTGSISVVVDDAVFRQELVLDSPELALHVPPMVWAIQYKYSADAVLLVLASDLYQADDYIRDYDQFLDERRAFDAHRS